MDRVVTGQVAHQGRVFQAEVSIIDSEVVVYLPMEVLSNCTDLTHIITFKDQETTLRSKYPRELYAAYGLSDEKIAWLESIKATAFDHPMICSFPVECRDEVHFDLYSGSYLASTSIEELKRRYSQRIQTV